MKKINLVALSVLALMVSSGGLVQAEESTGNTSTGRVNVSEINTTEPPVIVDPEEPGEEIVDPEITVPGDGRFMVTYAADFNFGEVEVNSREQTVYAEVIKVTTANGVEGTRVPWISTRDIRGSDRSPWTLNVSATELTDGNDNILRGAYMTLSNLHYSDLERSPQTVTDEVNLLDTAQPIAHTTIFSEENGTVDTGVGDWSLSLGARNDNTTDGVKLTIPRNTVINENVEYTATITWDLETAP